MGTAAAPAGVQTAYALLRVKSISDDARVITGTASTPEPDRMGDVVDSLGITFRNPVPLLLHHRSDKPVGRVTFDAPTADGLTFTASLPTIAEPGTLRDRVEEAWQSIKARLISGVSIGFIPTEDPTFNKKTGGFHFPATEVLELSLVTIPAHQGASIQTIKSLAAASGRVVSTLPRREAGVKAMTLQEQIGAYEATRTTKAQRMADLMAASAAQMTTLDAQQSDEYEGLDGEVQAIDVHLTRLRALETQAIAKAQPIMPTADPASGAAQRSAAPVITVKANVEPGIRLARFVMAKVWGKGDSNREIEYAKQWRGSTPEIEAILKAAVAPGTTTTTGWAAELAQLKPLTDEFLEYLRPATFLGKISGFKRVPFNITIPTQTAGGVYSWVGQGAPKGVTKLTFGSANLAITKCSGIIVITEELARVSTPSAEELVRRDMRDGIAQFLDTEFTDPTKAPVAGVSPGSITNGVTPITSAGTSPANARTDLAALLTAMTAANISVAGAVLLMSEVNALALSFSATPLGEPAFPNMTPTGGAMMGITCFTSQTLGSNVIALNPGSILMADDGGITIDVSREASIQMDSAPDNPALATTIMTSFWQNNLIGLRAERFINWKNVRAGAVQRTVQTYVPGTLSMAAATETTPTI